MKFIKEALCEAGREDLLRRYSAVKSIDEKKLVVETKKATMALGNGIVKRLGMDFKASPVKTDSYNLDIGRCTGTMSLVYSYRTVDRNERVSDRYFKLVIEYERRIWDKLEEDVTVYIEDDDTLKRDELMDTEAYYGKPDINKIVNGIKKHKDYRKVVKEKDSKQTVMF